MDARITALEAAIPAYETAILLFATNGAQQEYWYDSGQGQVKVERADPVKMRAVIDEMMNQLAVYCVRAGKVPGTFQVRPSA